MKKEQPMRKPKNINRLLEQIYGLSMPPSTLYRHKTGQCDPHKAERASQKDPQTMSSQSQP
jgi:hypothetical protein